MDLKLEDLIIKCERCNATGWHKEKTGSRTDEGPCPDCGGVGGKYTEAGKVIKRFIQIAERNRYL